MIEYDQFSRTRMLVGDEKMRRLQDAHVAVFGLGGVGGYVAEALVRSGIGALDLIDNDTVALSNLNRQILATHETIGRYKADVAAERALQINPDVKLRVYKVFYLPENASMFDFTEYDYVVDAIDTVTGKIQLIMQAKEAGVPIISAMGAGNKMDASAFRVADIYDTRICPLARIMRRELKKRGVESLKVVYSEEPPLEPEPAGRPSGCPDSQAQQGETVRRRATPGSVAFVPAAAGLIMAGEVVRDLMG